MCGRIEGQEEMLPEWISLLATKNMSTDGKRVVIRKVLQENLRCPENPIPMHPALVKMLIAKEFTGDDDSTAGGNEGTQPILGSLHDNRGNRGSLKLPRCPRQGNRGNGGGGA